MLQVCLIARALLLLKNTNEMFVKLPIYYSLLEIKPYTEEGKDQRKVIIEDEVKTFENKQISPESSGERFGYLLITIISTIALSVPVLLLGIFKFLLLGMVLSISDFHLLIAKAR